jgi:hypothetical protein
VGGNPAAAIQAATNVASITGSASTTSATPTSVSVSGVSSAGLLGGEGSKMSKGTDVTRGLSPETMNKLKTSFKQILREHEHKK